MNNATELPDDVSFATVDELKKWLLTLKAKVLLGELRQGSGSSPFATEISVLDVNVDGPWPDYIEWQFESVTSLKRYRLMANPYHGSGGSWKTVG